MKICDNEIYGHLNEIGAVLVYQDTTDKLEQKKKIII